MFLKRQTRAIPELAHVVVPLTCSLALYLCNLLSLSLLTAEMLLALPLFVLFLNKQILLPYKTKGIFQLNEPLNFQGTNVTPICLPCLFPSCHVVNLKEDAA